VPDSENPLALFGVSADGNLGQMWQPAPHVGWSYWEEFGIALRGAPVVAQNADGRLEVFGIGENGRLGHFWQLIAQDVKRWAAWDDLGPDLLSDPAVLATGDGRLEVFGIGPDGCLGHVWQRPAPGRGTDWPEWGSFGHPIVSRPAPCLNGAGRVEVFAIGLDGCLGHIWQVRAPDGGIEWSGWRSFGQPLQSEPAVGRKADGLLEVFAIGGDGLLGHAWQRRQHGDAIDWSEWESLGVALRSPPTVILNPSGRLEVFAIGPDGCLGHLWQVPDESGFRRPWSDWGSFGHVIHSRPKVMVNSHGGLEVFAIGENRRLGHLWQWSSDPSKGWGNWESLGPPITEDWFAVSPHGARPAETHPDGSVRGAEDELDAQTRAASRTGGHATLTADVCVIGAGPAGITLAMDLLDAGASVVLLESGGWGDELEAEELNHGTADGTIIKGYPSYLSDTRRRRVQGTAVLWGRLWCMPFRAIDFESRAWVANSGWPISRAELSPYEQHAAATIGIDGFLEPQPDHSLVRLSYQYLPGASPFGSILRTEIGNPRLQLETGATAVGLSIDDGRVGSVRVARFDGDLTRVEAGTVVLAGGGIENARLLLLHEQALPAATMVGRCFMEHPHVFCGTVSLPDVSAVRPYLASGKTMDVLGLPDDVQGAERLLSVSVELRPKDRFVPAAGAIECELIARAEQAPNPESRVLLGARRDRFDCPEAQLEWRLLEQDWCSVVRTAELTAAALESDHGAAVELQIKSESPWPWDPQGPLDSPHSTWGHHHLGTTRMSADPSDGVVDVDCRVHGMENLYVAGSSVFPTGSCANPTFMIVALAHRLAAHLSG
jgi:hypothetical protein